MNSQARNRNHEQGGVLVVTFFILTSIFIALGSYLLLVRAQYVSIVRSQAWNDSMSMAEAGVEDALAQLNPGATDTTISVDRTANGWGSPSGGFYGPVARTIRSNSTYSVVFTTNVQPIIYATGYLTLPDISATVKRVVRVATTNIPLFNVAMAARTNISMNGSGVSADSFDSSRTNLSTGGKYDSSKAGTNGDIGVLYGTLDTGNHIVAGDVYLGPTASFAGTATGQTYNDYNIDFPDVVTPPNTGGWTVLAPTGYPLPANVVNVGGTLTTFNYVFNTSGDYVISSMLGSGTIYVAPGARVRLMMKAGTTTGVKVDGTGSNPGNLIVYVATASFTIGGNGAIDGGRSANLTYLGLPTCTSVNFNGNATFIGTLYAPDATVTLGGGGSQNIDFSGSLIGKTIKINGHFSFHFDEDLLNNGSSRGYHAVSWAEL